MAQISVTLTLTGTSAQIAKAVLGMERMHGRLNGETDLQFWKRLCKDIPQDGYNLIRREEIISEALASNPTSGEIDVS